VLLFIIAVKSDPSVWWNGLNVPWNSFGYDIGTNAFNITWFNVFFLKHAKIIILILLDSGYTLMEELLLCLIRMEVCLVFPPLLIQI